MKINLSPRQVIAIILIASSIHGCMSLSSKMDSPSTTTILSPTPILPINPPSPNTTQSQISPTPGLTGYEFPATIYPETRYLIYLHGKILEDQGLPAVSPDFGVYEYEAILKKFNSYGFTVISEQRPKNADVNLYARVTIKQINLLLDADVPPENITVVGASKGGYIAATVSSLLKNSLLNFVLLGACSREMIDLWKQNHMYFYGNILAIYDSVDDYACSCTELFTFSEGNGIASHDEIVLHTGKGHGILYQPMDGWMIPILQFAGIDH